MKRASGAIGALVLIACTAAPTLPPIPAGPPIPDAIAERVVLEYLNRTLRDPASLQQFRLFSASWITSWPAGHAGSPREESGWVWCFEYNAKNALGALAGLQTDGLILRTTAPGTAVVVRPITGLRVTC